MEFEDDGAGRIVLRESEREGEGEGKVALAEYVYAPTDAPLESPRPYALLRTRDGVEVTAYRPADHVWHKGLSLALPVVGPHNFWGGPTYVHGEGYVQLPNNGAQVHRGFGRIEPDSIDERLDWVSEDGDTVLVERRTLTARVVDDTTWALTWRSALRNVTSAALAFGSPTTKGRADAGYAGIFWRGPAAFTGGEIIGPDGAVGDAARGRPGPWLAFIAPDRSAGVLVLDAADPVSVAGTPRFTSWFARSDEYAGLNPAPFFHAETVLPAADTLVLAAAVVVGGADVASHAAAIGAPLVAELREAASHPFEEPPA